MYLHTKIARNYCSSISNLIIVCLLWRCLARWLTPLLADKLLNVWLKCLSTSDFDQRWQVLISQSCSLGSFGCFHERKQSLTHICGTKHCNDPHCKLFKLFKPAESCKTMSLNSALSSVAVTWTLYPGDYRRDFAIFQLSRISLRYSLHRLASVLPGQRKVFRRNFWKSSLI